MFSYFVKPRLIVFMIFAAVMSLPSIAQPNSVKANEWIDNEFADSTLSKQQQRKEMQWFIGATKPYEGMTIRVISERIHTHWYEANVLAKAFEDITGIKVVHEITGEDDLIKKLSTQMDLDHNIYDAYVNDSDLIGTHYRSGKVVPISDFIDGDGADVTLPTLDLEDFIGLSFVTGPDGKLYQLPDQQFANLYWYRHDWFSRPDLKRRFRSIYGYELDVPENWSAYEDIAEFFTVHVGELDGQKVYGHMDYGKKDPSLGWRFSDAWLSMAGMGDKGLPNGLPVDEWGIRVENCVPVGASVARGGAINSPASIFAISKYVEWLKKFAPPKAQKMNFSEAGSQPAKGNIAQQIFWYTAFTSSLIEPGLPITYPDGTPKWRMAPSPKGPYWEKGMKLGYQDAGAWTFLTSTPLKRRKAAWLYAQFLVSKTVSLRKTLVGLTPIRYSDIHSEKMTTVAHKYGGLIEFYRSAAKQAWTPTGTNVPDYPGMSDLWWKNISMAASEELTPKETMNKMAEEMDGRLQEIADKERGKRCLPVLNKKRSDLYWLNKEGAPKPKLAIEKPLGKTFTYEESLKVWD
jgi:glycerol transport system substrate-binding protein